MVSKHQDNTDLVRRNTDLVRQGVGRKPLEIGVGGKPLDLGIVGPLDFGTTDLVLQSNPEIPRPDVIEPEHALEQKHAEVIILVVCAFCLLFVVSFFRQRHTKARQAQEQSVIDSILAASRTLYPTMRSYDVVLRRVNSDDEENGWVSVLVGRNWREQECFLRQSRRHKKSTRADALGDLYLEMVAETKA